MAFTHLQEKRFQCVQCEKRFVSKQALSDHFNSHTGEQPFQCDICGASYKQSSKFSRHLKKHKLAGELILPINRVKRGSKNLDFKYREIVEDRSMSLPLLRKPSSFQEELPISDLLAGEVI